MDTIPEKYRESCKVCACGNCENKNVCIFCPCNLEDTNPVICHLIKRECNRQHIKQ